MPQASIKRMGQVKLVPVMGAIPELPTVDDLNPRGIPEPPARLVGNHRKTWDMLCKILDDAGVLTLSDGIAVALMVQAWEEIQECEQHILSYGRVYEVTDGGGNRLLRANPSVAMMANADRRFRAYLLDFGIMPSGRRYIAPQDPANPQKPFNPLSEFLQPG